MRAVKHSKAWTRKKYKCPDNKVRLVVLQSPYGRKWECPVAGCTVACWGGPTSTPADAATRKARIAAHAQFDQIWKSGRMRRAEAYKRLQDHLGLSKGRTHIGMFDAETCARVIEFCKSLDDSS